MAVAVQEAGSRPHTAVILFYKYFVDPNPSSTSPASFSSAHALLQRYPDFYLAHVQRFQKELCHRLQLKGRVLLAVEGINGSLSAASRDQLHEYERSMASFDLLQYSRDYDNSNDGNVPPGITGEAALKESCSAKDRFLFSGIDWKASSLRPSTSTPTAAVEPFPDLKITIVKELVSTGGSVETQDIPNYGGSHLTPREFHQVLVDHQNKQQQSSSSSSSEQSSPENNTNNKDTKDVVLIDVRNTFEYDIGHFVNPSTQEAAMNPEMTAFSAFESQFCDKHANFLQDKTVLMYCTGGIRCEKASVMLKRRGVPDVYQLQGGIHRYLEEYGDEGFFQGRNFVFDQRVALTPADQKIEQQSILEEDTQKQQQHSMLEDHGGPSCLDGTTNSSSINNNKGKPTCVGKCVECQVPFDELSGARTCTVCRDLVLVCPSCQETLREYHCRRHAPWKDCYFCFLEVFSMGELQRQHAELHRLRNVMLPAKQFRHTRRTLHRQIAKVEERMAAVRADPSIVDPNAPRRCRTCLEPNTVCPGLCWGFWRTTAAAAATSMQYQQEENGSVAVGAEENSIGDAKAILVPVSIGDQVEPGPHWNPVRLGDRYNAKDVLLRGTVVEIKSWGVGSLDADCVVVTWNNENGHDDDLRQQREDKGESNIAESSDRRLIPRRQPQIYRWGVPALNGLRMYDVQHVS